VEGLADRAGQVLDVLDDAIVFCDRPGNARGVGLLKGVVADQFGADLPGEGDHRRRVHHGGGQARNEIAGPGTAGGQDDADFAAGAGVGVGHVAAALLVARDDEADRRVEEPVEQGQDYTAGVAEHGIDTEIEQRIDNDLGACFCRGFFGGRRRSGRFGWHT